MLSRPACDPSQETAYCWRLGPPRRSFTSVMPNQLMIAATGIGIVDWSHSLVASNPADGTSMPVISARCPPADPPVITTREESNP